MTKLFVVRMQAVDNFRIERKANVQNVSKSGHSNDPLLPLHRVIVSVVGGKKENICGVAPRDIHVKRSDHVKNLAFVLEPFLFLLPHRHFCSGGGNGLYHVIVHTTSSPRTT
jgi:hypothetical protein